MYTLYVFVFWFSQYDQFIIDIIKQESSNPKALFVIQYRNPLINLFLLPSTLLAYKLNKQLFWAFTIFIAVWGFVDYTNALWVGASDREAEITVGFVFMVFSVSALSILNFFFLVYFCKNKIIELYSPNKYLFLGLTVILALLYTYHSYFRWRIMYRVVSGSEKWSIFYSSLSPNILFETSFYLFVTSGCLVFLLFKLRQYFKKMA